MQPLLKNKEGLANTFIVGDFNTSFKKLIDQAGKNNSI